MGYASVEARVQSLLQGLTTVFAQTSQVTRGDWKVLDAGYRFCAVVFDQGNFNEGEAYTAGANEYVWNLNIELFQRYLDDSTTRTLFAQNRDAVIQHLQKYPSLNGLDGIHAVGKISGGALTEVFSKDGAGPFFISQILTIPITELITVTIAE